MNKCIKNCSEIIASEINFSIQLIYIHRSSVSFPSLLLHRQTEKIFPAKPNYGTHMCLMFCLRQLVKYSEKTSLIQMLIESFIYLFNTSDDACFLFSRSLLIVLINHFRFPGSVKNTSEIIIIIIKISRRQWRNFVLCSRSGSYLLDRAYLTFINTIYIQ